MSGPAGALYAPSAVTRASSVADTGDAQAARCVAAHRQSCAIRLTANERNPAGGLGSEPGSEMRFAVGNAAPSCRGRPRAGTVRAEILAGLEAGRSLTSLDVWQELGGARLAADVYELKRLGWPIFAEEVEVTCRRGRVAKVARYRLLEGGGDGR